MATWLKSISLATLIAVAGVVPSQRILAHPGVIAQADTAEQLLIEAFFMFREEGVESLRQAITKLEQAVVLSR
ncbi:hypothetical protein [Roseofilum sp. Guam]|uniref:hypothetical protein n=1 Tax=Roseofilum sp. Guam TaxID=2821502 RepID=UPI00298D6659|nr:hypothetical protein [Roseofilum sp. Guam]